jgi:hypothetical protein
MKPFRFALPLLLAILSLACTAATHAKVDALIVVDIDGTLGEQETKRPDFPYQDMVKVPGDKFGDFYFYVGALDFLRTTFKWKADAALSGKNIQVALFTMGSGARNEMVRDFIEDKLDLKRDTLSVYDYSNAVFSEELVQRWRTKDPSLASHWKDYFDGLEKPITTERFSNSYPYYKDLSRLLPLYLALDLSNIRIVDDNKIAVPQAQLSQLIVFGPKTDYVPAIDQLKIFLNFIRR